METKYDFDVEITYLICNLTSKAGGSCWCFLCILFHSVVKFREMGVEIMAFAAKETYLK